MKEKTWWLMCLGCGERWDSDTPRATICPECIKIKEDNAKKVRDQNIERNNARGTS